MVRTNRPTTTAGVIACAAFAIVLSGCTGQSDALPTASPTASASTSASPTGSPTPANPAKAAKQERIADALRRYEEYLEIDEKHQKAGTNGYEDVALYVGHPDIHSNEQMKWDYIAEHGIKMVGDRKPIVSVVDATYDGNPLANTVSGHRVHLDLCVNATGFEFVDAGGEVVPVTDPGPDQSVLKVVMQGQPGEQWTINKITSTKKVC